MWLLRTELLGWGWSLGLCGSLRLSRSLRLSLLDWAETKLKLRSSSLLRCCGLRNWNSLGNLGNRSGSLWLNWPCSLGLSRSWLSGPWLSWSYLEGIRVDRGTERS